MPNVSDPIAQVRALRRQMERLTAQLPEIQAKLDQFEQHLGEIKELLEERAADEDRLVDLTEPASRETRADA